MLPVLLPEDSILWEPPPSPQVLSTDQAPQTRHGSLSLYNEFYSTKMNGSVSPVPLKLATAVGRGTLPDGGMQPLRHDLVSQSIQGKGLADFLGHILSGWNQRSAAMVTKPPKGWFSSPTTLTHPFHGKATIQKCLNQEAQPMAWVQLVGLCVKERHWVQGRRNWSQEMPRGCQVQT